MMNCKKVQDFLYNDFEDCSLPERFLIFLHLLHCDKCTQYEALINKSTTIMQNDYFPPAENNFAETIASIINTEINAENTNAVEEKYFPYGPLYDNAENYAVSLRAWIITGLVVLFSLATSFFGIGFLNSNDRLELSFLLPLGLTIGGVITAFGAIFIASHLSELSKRFNELAKRFGFR